MLSVHTEVNLEGKHPQQVGQMLLLKSESSPMWQQLRIIRTLGCLNDLLSNYKLIAN